MYAVSGGSASRLRVMRAGCGRVGGASASSHHEHGRRLGCDGQRAQGAEAERAAAGGAIGSATTTARGRRRGTLGPVRQVLLPVVLQATTKIMIILL